MTTLPAWKTHRIAVTPLSPIHIGCGEDYEPTGFVLEPDENLLFAFDPSQATLDDAQRNKLLRCATEKNTDTLRSIYLFYQANKEQFKAFSKTIVPVDNDTKNRIQSILKGHFKNNTIERTSYCRQQGAEMPYVPGSSLKGIIHTALLNRLVKNKSINPSNKRQDLDELILQGKMNESPMKLLKVSDLMPSSQAIFTRIISWCRFAKDKVPYETKEAGSILPTQPMETISMGQYRAFEGQLQLRSSTGLKGEPDVRLTHQDPKAVLKDLHAYCLLQFQEDLAFWEKGNKATQLWVRSLAQLLSAYESKFKEGTAALVSLGKHTGAEGKFLRDDRNNFIIAPPTKAPSTVAVAKCPIKDTDGSIYLPFGWALIELDSQADVPLLKDWCTQNKFNFDLQAFREKFEVERRAETERKLALQAEKLEEEKKREEAQKAEEAKEKALKEMPENQRLATQLEEILQKVADAKPGSDANKQTVDLLNAAKAWDKVDQRFLAQKVRPFVKKKKLDEGKSGKLIKSLLNAFEAS